MDIRFYKNTLSDAQIVELLKLDDDFKLTKGNLIITFKERQKGFDRWYDDSGSFDVFNSERDKDCRNTETNYKRLYPFAKFNKAQIALYEKFIHENYTVKICPYWTLKNDDDKQKAVELLGEFEELNFQYPFVVGKEGSLFFQGKLYDMKDFVSHDNKTIYKYELQEF